MNQLELDLATANAKLAEALDLLSLAQDAILTLRSGRGTSPYVAEGVWVRKNDRA
jgi:hypothetical protein